MKRRTMTGAPGGRQRSGQLVGWLLGGLLLGTPASVAAPPTASKPVVVNYATPSVSPGAEITVRATYDAGGLVPSFQWQFKGQDIAGATKAILTLTNVGLDDASEYAAGFDDFVGKPLTFERLYESLAALPGTRLVEAATAAPSVVPSADLLTTGPRTLPVTLRRQLQTAARLYRTTELKRCLREIARLSPEGAALARRLETLNDAGDMAAIQAILDGLPGSVAPDEPPP